METEQNRYARGKIYSIRSHQTTDIYIGSTIDTLPKRLHGHKKNYKCFQNGKYNYITSFEIIKYDDAYIELIENYSCNSKYELERKEGEHIRNTECVNKVIAGRTENERYNDNKDIISEQMKEYYQGNRDNILVKVKEYYQKNRDYILEQKKQYQDDNKDAILLKQKQYYQDNKDAILEKRKQYQDDNKDAISLRRKQIYKNKKSLCISEDEPTDD